MRSGRANVNLLDNIRVSYYGQPTPLNQVAALQVPEARQITIKPWESNLLKEIERAILQSAIGLPPNNDGTLIRLVIPPLTEERRKDLVKTVHKQAEEAKKRIRGFRREANDEVRAHQKGGKITEDEAERSLKQVQKLTDEAEAKVDGIVSRKEKELMEI